MFREHAKFFRLSGFRLVDWRLNRYRRGTSELIWKTTVKAPSWYQRLERTPSRQAEPKDPFWGNPNWFSTKTAWLLSSSGAYECWFSNQSRRALDQSPNDNSPHWAGCRSPIDQLVSRHSASLESSWLRCAQRRDFCKCSTGLFRLFHNSDSHAQNDIPFAAASGQYHDGGNTICSRYHIEKPKDKRNLNLCNLFRANHL